jgi:hypothetical protein
MHGPCPCIRIVNIGVKKKRNLYACKRAAFVRKTACISDRNKSMKKAQPIDSAIVSRIYGAGRGSVFTPTRFLGLGGRAVIDKTLSRLAQRGTIRRLARGLYDFPKTHPQLGLLMPTADEIAAALAGPAGLKLQPSGAYAANLLGLSEQVPMKVVFLTTGTPRRVRIGRREIILKRTTPRQMKTAGRVSGLVIQALRYLGQRHVDATLLSALGTRLKEEDKRQLLTDIPLAPGWIAEHLRKLAKE